MTRAQRLLLAIAALLAGCSGGRLAGARVAPIGRVCAAQIDSAPGPQPVYGPVTASKTSVEGERAFQGRGDDQRGRGRMLQGASTDALREVE